MVISVPEMELIAEHGLVRDDVLAGRAREWLEPDTAELVPLAGKQIPAAQITSMRDIATVANYIAAEAERLAAKLAVKLRAGYLNKPVATAELDASHRISARHLNLLMLQRRAIDARIDQLTAAEEARVSAERVKHVMVLRQLLDEAHVVVSARAAVVGNLDERVRRVGQFLEDIGIVATAAALRKREAKLRDLLQRTAENLGEKCPPLPDLLPDNLDTKALEKLSMILNLQSRWDSADVALMTRAHAALRALGRA